MHETEVIDEWHIGNRVSRLDTSILITTIHTRTMLGLGPTAITTDITGGRRLVTS